jgi:hypothetical protein
MIFAHVNARVKGVNCNNVHENISKDSRELVTVTTDKWPLKQIKLDRNQYHVTNRTVELTYREQLTPRSSFLHKKPKVCELTENNRNLFRSLDMQFSNFERSGLILAADTDTKYKNKFSIM